MSETKMEKDIEEKMEKDIEEKMEKIAENYIELIKQNFSNELITPIEIDGKSIHPQEIALKGMKKIFKDGFLAALIMKDVKNETSH